MVQNIIVVSRIIQSPLGFLEASAGDGGISRLVFSDNPTISIQQSTTNLEESSVAVQHLDDLETELTEYFAGKRNIFTVKLAPEGTPFQQTVWQQLLKIPFGSTNSYSQQTAKLGSLSAIRAVASANARNPIAILIPCHRVIGSDGRLTGYAGGLHRKKWLLDHERINSGHLVQGSLFD